MQINNVSSPSDFSMESSMDCSNNRRSSVLKKRKRQKRRGNRHLKRYENDYHIVLVPEDESRWSLRRAVLRTMYKAPKRKKRYYYHVGVYDRIPGKLYAKVPIRAGSYILQYKNRYLRGPVRYGKDYMLLLFNESDIYNIADTIRIRRKKRLSQGHLERLWQGRDRYIQEQNTIKQG